LILDLLMVEHGPLMKQCLQQPQTDLAKSLNRS